MLLEHCMMKEAQNWLEEQQHEKHDSNNRVCLVQQAQVRSHVDANAECRDVDQISKYLQ